MNLFYWMDRFGIVQNMSKLNKRVNAKKVKKIKTKRVNRSDIFKTRMKPIDILDSNWKKASPFTKEN